jgi:asparagine synthase (glutamine-hydrolysing)
MEKIKKILTPLPPILHPRLLACAVPDHPVALSQEGSCLESVLRADLLNHSLPALLHYADRSSMVCGVEARVPFLDHRIVDLAFSLPSHLKIKGPWTKWILRRIAEHYVPRQVAWRRSKMGYPTPFSLWMRQKGERENFYDVLFSGTFLKREILNPQILKTYWNQHQKGVADHSVFFTRCVTTELWFRSVIEASVKKNCQQRKENNGK